MFKRGHREEKYRVVDNTKHAKTGEDNMLAQVHTCLHTRAQAATRLSLHQTAASGSSSQWLMVIHICFPAPGPFIFCLSHKALTEGAVPSPFSPMHRPCWSHQLPWWPCSMV